MKKVLMVAYHYPPEGSSSGVQRTLKFSQYLEEFGWAPLVLTASPRAYGVSRPDQLEEVPKDIVVRRAFALDAKKHLSIRGRYLRATALPDDWVSWWPSAVMAGLFLVWRHRPDVIWSTYPIATAHLIGWSLARLTGLPWVADFRDSMTEEHYPRDETKRRAYQFVERKTVRACSRLVFTTPGAVSMYRKRYPEIAPECFTSLPNGYDESSFRRAEQAPPANVRRSRPDEVVLLHSGILYPIERDPRAFYDALATLLREGRVAPGDLKVVLRASGHDGYHQRCIEERGIEALVTLEPPLAYHQALREMMEVDGLLVFQADNCNHQVPAKIYEYLRARRPILALTDPVGDTARVLSESGAGMIVPLDDARAIAGALLDFVERARQGGLPSASPEVIASHSRRARTEKLAALLGEVAAERVAS